MSRQLINEYRSELDRIVKVGGTLNEGTVRDAFQSLLKSWGKSNDLVYLSEHRMTGSGGAISVDGALMYSIRVPFGYWEAKDSKDDLEQEIRKKEAKGYPKTNIIYEDTRRAVLIQDGTRIAEADMDDTDALYALLERFFAYEQTAIRDFRKAIAKFAEDLPAILEALRDRIRKKREESEAFSKAEEGFLKQVRETINPALERADVTEMLIQHILTEEIFRLVFDAPDYHRENNVAQQLYALERQLFGARGKRQMLHGMQAYYTGIRDTAHLIESHSEKQNFLKSLYENFYKVYNPKAADRLGVVYTPGEIVRFMIRSADWLCEKHFGKNLVDPGVEILDPATGTGTYIVELLEYFRGQPDKLKKKYKEELHANEVAILPYYVANLNIEATYQAITDEFAEFEGLCLVDTLDNVDGLGIHAGHQLDMLGAMSDENSERVKRQNRRKISVVIGNPPYNANQRNENDKNKNREYPHVDDRIKRTYVKESTAQKTKLYDMYSRFYRWASDRLGDEGIVTFVNNNSFLEARTFDGFRKRMAEEFNEAWIVDLKGNARTSGERRRREGGNVFEDKIKVGIAVAFFIRKKSKKSFTVNYLAVDNYATEDDKRSYIASRDIARDKFIKILPNERGTWLNQMEDNGWSGFLPLVSRKKTKKQKKKAPSIFHIHSNGVVSSRDDWVTDQDIWHLKAKVGRFISVYRSEQVRWASSDERKKAANKDERLEELTEFVLREIKWTSELEAHLDKGSMLSIKDQRLLRWQDRPFIRMFATFGPVLTHRRYNMASIFPSRKIANRAFGFSGLASSKPFQSLAIDRLPSYDLLEKTQFAPRYAFDDDGERIDNITDWAVGKFTKHYGKKADITKDAIFAYCYAVLHDPAYREKYALNLKREFPRIPFYPDFAQWARWGETLLGLHIDYEEVEPWDIERVDTPNPKRAEGSAPKPKLKSVLAEGAETGSVVVDEDTQITGIPAGAWDYRLGNRSAIDWVLDQHKEKKPRDPTIREKFNTYKFADYKESMIELLAKVVRVSVETNEITDAMAVLDRSDWE